MPLRKFDIRSHLAEVMSSKEKNLIFMEENELLPQRHEGLRSSGPCLSLFNSLAFPIPKSQMDPGG